MSISSTVKDAVNELVHSLVMREFDKLASDGRAGRLSATELKTAIDEYGRALVDLPSEVWDLVDEYRNDGAGAFALDVPLWTAEEGRSDLTLSLTVNDSGGNIGVEIDDLHVL